MSNEEVRKLLAGYATNNLTEAERKSLFEAALNDQELFDALHEEQALKDLLDDPVSREQIRHALEEKTPAPARAAWWTRWWAWTGAATAVAAVVLTFAITRWNGFEANKEFASLNARAPAAATPAPGAATNAPPVVKSEPAAATPAPVAKPREKSSSDSKTVEQLRASKRVRDSNSFGAMRARPANERTDQIALAAPPAAGRAGGAAAPPPPAVSAQEQAQVIAQAPAPAPAQLQSDVQNRSQQAQTQVVDGLPDQVQTQARGAQLAASTALLKSTIAPMSYSLLKLNSDGTYQALPPNADLSAGDSVRLAVVPTTSGYLSLLREDPSGEWGRIYPQARPGVPVIANANYTIPDSPIKVGKTSQKFRLTLIPTSQNAKFVAGALRESSSEARAKAKKATSQTEQLPNTPLVIELTISPKKAP